MAVTALNFNDETEASEALYTDYVKSLLDAYRQGLGDIVAQLEKIYKQWGSADGRLDAQTLAKMDEGAKNKVTRLQTMQEQFAERIDGLNAGQPQELEAHLTQVYKINHDGGAEQIRMATSFDLVNERAVEEAYTREYAKIALEDNATFVRSGIREQITQGVLQGDPIEKMAKRIQGVLEQNLNNTVRIARTETTGIMGQARQDLFDEAEDKGMTVIKQWLATSDGRTRPSHVAINGQKRECDDVFDNGLRFPSDPLGSAGEVVNCRCTMTGSVLHEGEVFTKETVDVEKAKRDATQAKKDQTQVKREAQAKKAQAKVQGQKYAKAQDLVGHSHKIGSGAYTNFGSTFSPQSDLTRMKEPSYREALERHMVGLANQYPMPRLEDMSIKYTPLSGAWGNAGVQLKGNPSGQKISFEMDYGISYCDTLYSMSDWATSMEQQYKLRRADCFKDVLTNRTAYMSFDHEYGHMIDMAYRDVVDPQVDVFKTYVGKVYDIPSGEAQRVAQGLRIDMMSWFKKDIGLSDRIYEAMWAEASTEEYWLMTTGATFFTPSEIEAIKKASPYTTRVIGQVYRYLSFDQNVLANFGSYAVTDKKEFLAEGYAYKMNTAKPNPFLARFSAYFDTFYEEVIGGQ